MSLCIVLVLLSEICQVLAVDRTSGVTQDSGVITAEVGKTVSLRCFCRDDAVMYLSWYQQSLGGKPLIIATQMKQNTEASIFPAYKGRFRLESEGSINHLTISNISLSDSATYYCGITKFKGVEFGQGAFLHVKTSLSNMRAVVYHPTLERFQLGDSANLSCAVYAEKCAEEQSLYWFRHGASQPAVMYRSVGRCVNGSESHTKNCSLSISIKSVSSSDAGMYYCALASCGEIVFGKGMRVEISGGSNKATPLLVYYLSVALGVSIIVLLVLAFIMYKLKKQMGSVCKRTVSHLTCSAAAEDLSQDADVLHYGALSLNRASERHRQEESMIVYSTVMSRKE